MKNIEIIKNYLREKEMSMLKFSKFVGMSKQGIYKLMKHGRIRVDTARKIEIATKGKIKMSDFDITWPGDKLPKK